MRRYAHLLFASHAILGSQAAIWPQRQQQAPLGSSIYDDGEIAAPDDALGHLPLVDSEALQSEVAGKNLLKRAKELYAIAQLSENEFNHPTRVIGSAGHVGTLAYIY